MGIYVEGEGQHQEAKNRNKGTPQGGVISPLLANLYLHYTIDKWLKKNYPSIEMERYSDDIIFHCISEKQAEELKESVRKRLLECDLELNERKTKIVYCKDYRRRGKYPVKSFDFLGYSFKPMTKRSSWGLFLGYGVSISRDSRKRICEELRRIRFQRLTSLELSDLSKLLNPKIRGWMNYYGKYDRYGLSKTFRRLDKRIVRWLLNKYKKLRNQLGKGYNRLKRIRENFPKLFAHWEKFTYL